jgi:hypothetical protein
MIIVKHRATGGSISGALDYSSLSASQERRNCARRMQIVSHESVKAIGPRNTQKRATTLPHFGIYCAPTKKPRAVGPGHTLSVLHASHHRLAGAPGLGANGPPGGVPPYPTGAGKPGPFLSTGGSGGFNPPGPDGADPVAKALDPPWGIAPKPFGLAGGSGALELLRPPDGVDGLTLLTLFTLLLKPDPDEPGRPPTVPTPDEKPGVPDTLDLPAGVPGDVPQGLLFETLPAPFTPVPVVALGNSGGGALIRPLFCRGGSWHPHSTIPASNTLPTLSQGLDPISILLILEF